MSGYQLKSYLRFEVSRFGTKLPHLFNALVFFCMAASLAALSLSRDPEVMRHAAPVVLWLCVVFALTISVSGVFETDLTDGVLEQLITAKAPLVAMMSVRLGLLLAGLCLPLAGLCSLFAAACSLSATEAVWLGASVLIASPSVLLIGAFAAALAASLKHAAVVVPLISLPLVLPFVLLGLGFYEQALFGSPLPLAALLTGLFMLAALGLPWCTLHSLKLSLQA